MTQPIPSDVTLGEIVRTLQGLQEEIRLLRGEHVRRDLYEAHRAAIEAEVAGVRAQCQQDTQRLEARLDSAEADKTATRRQMLVASVGAGLAFIASMVLTVVQAVAH